MSNNKRPMPHAGIERLKTYVPGKPIEDLKRELGLSSIIKLASNENPLGTSPAARAALTNFDGALYRYPDGAGYEIKSALAARHGVTTDQLNPIAVKIQNNRVANSRRRGYKSTSGYQISG